MKLSRYLNEKVSKMEIEEALLNPNVRIGFEAEFLIKDFDKKYIEAIKMWKEWDAYDQQLEAWTFGTDEYEETGGEEAGDPPPKVPEWAKNEGYEDGDEVPPPDELFGIKNPAKSFNKIVKTYLPLSKLPFKNYKVVNSADYKDSNKWIIKPEEASAKLQVEIVSPILNIDEFLLYCPKLFDFIETYGYTDNTCGFHIGISLKNVPNLEDSLDVVKMAMFIDEEYIYKFFTSRKDNDFAISSKRDLSRNLSIGDIDNFIKKRIDIKRLKRNISIDHMMAINMEHLEDSPDKQYIEFRYLGGEDYHKKWNVIRTITAHYIWAISIGCDPTFKRKEYILKLNRLMLKHEMFTKIIQRDKLAKIGKKDTDEYKSLERDIELLKSYGVHLTPDERALFIHTL